MTHAKIPVIIDTDLGGDIDDSWALAYALQCPELDVRAVITATEDTTFRATVAARLLTAANRTDIPIGLGLPFPRLEDYPLLPYIGSYTLREYSGPVEDDGVALMNRIIMTSDQPVTILSIAPMPNIAEALRRQPQIMQRSRLVGMKGAVYKGWDGGDTVIAETNVVRHTPAAQAVFSSGWDTTITPLDTCGLIRLSGAAYQSITASTDPLTRELLKQYESWCRVLDKDDYPTRSSVLFDPVAIYLAHSEKGLEMETLKLTVTDDGFTRISEKGKPVRTAVRWSDMTPFQEHLTTCLR